MEAIRFAHISDTHLRSEADDPYGLDSVFDGLADLDQRLGLLFDSFVSDGLDFVLCTGDLVHEGTARDYERFRGLVDAHLGSVPFVCCLGNHDHKEAFYQGFLGLEDAHERAREPYLAATEVKGLKIVVLDSACSGKETGMFDPVEAEWLGGELACGGERGTIVAFHHPVLWSVPQLAMQVEPRMLELLTSEKVLGLFCGHTHEADVRFLNGVPQLTAASTAFGSAFLPDAYAITDAAAYSRCEFGDNGLSSSVRPLFPEPHVEVSIPFEKLAELMS